MIKYLQKLQALTLNFDHFEISHIPRSKNVQANILSQLATLKYNELSTTYIEHLDKSSIDDFDEVLQVHQESSWIDPIVEYLTSITLLRDPLEA